MGELDSSEYARHLMRPRKTAGVTVQGKPLGPIARARLEAAARSAQVHSTGTATVRVSPEYLLFLSDEISSLDYAEAVAGCAKLDGIYRAPPVLPTRKRDWVEAVADVLRLIFTAGGLSISMVALLLVLAPLGAKFAASIMQWAWTMSFVGAILLVLTVGGEASSRLQGAAHSLRRFVNKRVVHQRA